MDLNEHVVELHESGFCVLRNHFPGRLIEACREAFWPILDQYLKVHAEDPNRGPHRHFLPMPFHPPCFCPEIFFDPTILSIVSSAMDDRIVADQWGCDVPLRGSQNQAIHADYQRPLFAEAPDLPLPPYMIMVSFGLVPIDLSNGPIEIAPATHRMPRERAIETVNRGEIEMRPIPLALGDVLLRHPWALHRGTPNRTDIPRALAGIRYVRRWYADHSREVNTIPQAVWQSLTPQQQGLLRFPVEDLPG